VDVRELRASFPVCGSLCYLNAGTDGPLPRQALAAAAAELEHEARAGRTTAHWQRRGELAERLRIAYASVLCCEPSELALTTCTTEGLAVVIDGLGLRRGEEILTSDEEHPGLLGALAVASELCGVTVRTAPFADLAGAAGETTSLIACSHVSWMDGAICDVAALVESGIPVLLDGAQGVGAIPVDVESLGCAAYAGAGQKWLCGPDGLGMLYVAPQLVERIAVRRRGYGNLADPGAGLKASLHEDARRFETLCLGAETLAAGLAAFEVLAAVGWPALHERAVALAGSLAERLAEIGRAVASRGQSTLVSFSSEDPEGERERLAEQGILLRNIPGTSLLRASVGAWNDESDLERLLDALVA
jgi:selenocysteine lyase/cysteine desulfurase